MGRGRGWRGIEKGGREHTLSISHLTASKWPLNAAKCKGVRSYCRQPTKATRRHQLGVSPLTKQTVSNSNLETRNCPGSGR
eukprot:3722905-Rhodomonas_salina.2